MGLHEKCVPDHKLPQCWSDDVRMNALFAPFRIKSANPESWEMKMKFWSDMLRLWCRCKKDPIVSASDAKFVFQRKGRTPACLEIVVEEMFRNGELSPISKYQQMLHSGPETWVRWGARMAFKPAALALTAVSSLLPGRQAVDSDGLPKASIESTQRFVLESVIKDQATELLNNYPSIESRVGTIDDLLRRSAYAEGRETFELLLGYLVATGSAVNTDNIVKLGEVSGKVCEVSAAEAGLVRLGAAEARLAGEAARLGRDAAAADADARAAFKLGNKIAAKNHLRRKHKLAERADRCEGALENVRRLAAQLDDVGSQADLLNTYRMSSQAMKQGMKDNGLEEHSVHDTLDDLKEVMDDYNEVEKALSATTEEFDAAELEKELQELLSPAPTTPGKDDKNKRVREVGSPGAEFVFDGEERVIAELNALSVRDASPGGKLTPGNPRVVPLARPLPNKLSLKLPIKDEVDSPEKERPSQPWYPRGERDWGSPVEAALRRLGGTQDIHLDDRLHPGQQLNISELSSSPPSLFGAEFQVRDHRLAEGVWLYNTRDAGANIDNDLAASTEYFSTESPGKSGRSFQMAPGGERKKSHGTTWPYDDDDLERRLKNLRGFNL